MIKIERKWKSIAKNEVKILKQDTWVNICVSASGNTSKSKDRWYRIGYLSPVFVILAFWFLSHIPSAII